MKSMAQQEVDELRTAVEELRIALELAKSWNEQAERTISHLRDRVEHKESILKRLSKAWRGYRPQGTQGGID